MKRLLPGALIVLLAQPVHAAQWVKVGSAGGSVSYLDKSSIRRAGAEHRAALLVSFADVQTNPDGTRYRSMKAQHLYSCAQRSTTLLSQSYYPEPMGKGPVGQSFKYEKFMPEEVAPGSAAAGALELICKAATR